MWAWRFWSRKGWEIGLGNANAHHWFEISLASVCVKAGVAVASLYYEIFFEEAVFLRSELCLWGSWSALSSLYSSATWVVINSPRVLTDVSMFHSHFDSLQNSQRVQQTVTSWRQHHKVSIALPCPDKKARRRPNAGCIPALTNPVWEFGFHGVIFTY